MCSRNILCCQILSYSIWLIVPCRLWLNRAGTGSEPDDWSSENPQGEDCGHIDNNEEDLSSWMDGSCDYNYRWICEKSV